MDLKMLLKNCRPLFQSRNSAIFFSVLQLHRAIFLTIDGKALVNLSSHHQDNAEKNKKVDDQNEDKKA